MLTIRKSRQKETIKISNVFKFDTDIIDTTNFNITVSTPYGYKKIDAFSRTEPLENLTLYFTNGKTLKCASNHRLKVNGDWKFSKDIKSDDIIETDGKFTSLKNTIIHDKKCEMYDIQVNDVFCYYSNSILSHNSWVLCFLGKTALLCGKNVVHYTLELRAHQIGVRYDAMISGIPANDVVNQFEFVNKKLEEMRLAGSGKHYIVEYPTKSASINTISLHINKLISQGHRPDLVIVDYADLLKAPRHYGEKRFELESIYEELRGLAGIYDIPIWSAAQTNRAGMNVDVVGVELISEAFSKAQIADIVITLSRKVEDRLKNTGRIFVAKSRVGKDGIVIPIIMDTSVFTMETQKPFDGMDELKKELEQLSNNVDGDLKSHGAEMYKKFQNERK